MLGGGNVKKLKTLPPGCRAGDNANAFLGGFRLWEQAEQRDARSPRRSGHTAKRSGTTTRRSRKSASSEGREPSR